MMKKKESNFTKPSYFSLSVKDLLEAREDFHFHLSNLKNVVGTAVGLYRIRNKDPDSKDPTRKADRKKAAERTLANSSIQEWSWPCILVFVSQWQTIEEFRENPDDVIPRFVYMPDGRKVPICVVKAEVSQAGPPPLQSLSLPNQLMGGGYPVFSDVQGQQHMGSLGCLVTDGDRIYGLTNRHVVGEKSTSEPGRKVYTFVSLKPERQEIGISSNKQMGKKLLGDVYEGWPGSRSLLVIDAGLIELTDVNDWTAQVYGIGEIGKPLDLNISNISLNLIGCPVRAFGGASGEMKGQIQALFYRYKSIGGFDYVADLLIGPRDESNPLMTREGDSGSVWFFDEESPSEEEVLEKGERARRVRPVALQWGGQKLMTGKNEEELSFALATNLSTICRELDIDVVRSWNIGYGEYWGKLGHYKIGAKAIELIPDGKLKVLMQKNLSNISFADDAIRDGQIERIDKSQFVPLADVPDLAWGRSGPWLSRRDSDDSDNHFADMDENGKGGFEGQTLLKLTENPNNVDFGVWNRFYDTLEKDRRGSLPFRIWHVYNEMVNFLKQKNVPSFVCAAGILAHYVGDACNPLHVSQYYDGRTPEEEGVHSAYETRMMDSCAAEIIIAVNGYLENKTAADVVRGGHSAAVYAIELMRSTLNRLPPTKLIDAYNAAKMVSHHYIKPMFIQSVNDSTLGEETAICIGEGCLALASIWKSAWEEGNGEEISDGEIIEIERATLKVIYDNKEFLKSLKMDDPEFANLLVDSI
jgi:hypothetical protein